MTATRRRLLQTGLAGGAGLIAARYATDPAAADGVPVLLTHGQLDPVIVASFGDDARTRLEAAGAAVEWRAPAIGHELDPVTVLRARELVDELFGT